MTHLDRAVATVANVLAGHWWPEAVRVERARNVVQVWSCSDESEPFTEAHAAEQIRAARLPCYGGLSLSDDEIASLAARVVLALSLLDTEAA